MPVLGRSRRFVLTSLAAAVLGPSARPAGAGPSLEYAVKANYLYKFAPFVEWPPQVFAENTTPLSICVAGEDPFGAALDEAVRGQTYNGRPIVIRRMATVAPGAPCHVLFIRGSPAQSVADALKVVAGAPVLTVTDGEHGAEAGVIQFVVEGGHVRFDIDEAAARADGLTISSKLLSLAVSKRKSGA